MALGSGILKWPHLCVTYTAYAAAHFARSRANCRPAELPLIHVRKFLGLLSRMYSRWDAVLAVRYLYDGSPNNWGIAQRTNLFGKKLFMSVLLETRKRSEKHLAEQERIPQEVC